MFQVKFCGAIATLAGALVMGLSSLSYAGFEPLLDYTALDLSVDPCSDFYSYSCGGWLNRSEAPPDRPFWSRSVSTIQEANLAELRGVLEAYSESNFVIPNQTAEKIGAFYLACMDTEAIERTHLEALNSELAVLDHAKREELPGILEQLYLRGHFVLFRITSSLGSKKSSPNLAELDQRGLSLPNKNDYFDTDRAPIREKFVKHVARMLEISGIRRTQSLRQASSILAFETELARYAVPQIDQRSQHISPSRTLSKGQLRELAPFFNWDHLLDELDAPPFEMLRIVGPEFFKRLSLLLAQAPFEQIQSYLKWQIIHSMAADLGQSFVEENFNFYGKDLLGQKGATPRWKYCTEAADQSFQEALVEPLFRKSFGKNARDEAISLIEKIQKEFKKSINSNSWLDASTRSSALEKLDAIENKVGYLGQSTDFSSLRINPGDHIQNRSRIALFWALRSIKKIGQPADHVEWGFSPTMVNAYYELSRNEIIFPAGIFQSPFFLPGASLALNYGAIGAVIGHELTHAFDDEGRQYDASGNFKNWWTQEVRQIFEEKGECLVDQYSSYLVFDDVHINGRLTLGENMADLEGLKLAYAAYREVATLEAPDARARAWQINWFNFLLDRIRIIVSQGVVSRELSRLSTGDQQFFISFAQLWCTQNTSETKKYRAAIDLHSAPKYRVNGVVANMPEFERAFHCSPGAPLAPLNRCSIW